MNNRFIHFAAMTFLIFAASVPADAIPWIEETDSAFLEAERSGRPVLLLVTGGLWCDPCNWLEENTLAQRSVSSLIAAGFVPVRILDTDPGWDDWGVERLPTLLVLDATGEEIDRVAGAVTPPVLQELLAPHAASLPGVVRESSRSDEDVLRGAVFRIGSTGTLWNDGGANWFSQDAGLPPRLEEYDRDETFLYLRDRGSATLLGVPLERALRGAKSSLWRWNLETRDWEEAADLDRLD
ncbi:MAG: thioredoxin family protein [Spirochaetaceae bacterium]|nr:MAG: thioredoxin family protein [Spirochaetaceae bacterium]